MLSPQLDFICCLIIYFVGYDEGAKGYNLVEMLRYCLVCLVCSLSNPLVLAFVSLFINKRGCFLFKNKKQLVGTNYSVSSICSGCFIRQPRVLVSSFIGLVFTFKASFMDQCSQMLFFNRSIWFFSS